MIHARDKVELHAVLHYIGTERFDDTLVVIDGAAVRDEPVGRTMVCEQLAAVSHEFREARIHRAVDAQGERVFTLADLVDAQVDLPGACQVRVHVKRRRVPVRVVHYDVSVIARPDVELRR